MKKNLTFLFLYLISLYSFSQENLTYKGIYKGSETKGEVEYEYYENDEYERIYNGVFKYTGSDNYNGFDIIVNGSFNENKKVGNWSYKLSKYQTPNFNAVISGKYDNGYLIGSWLFERTKVIYETGEAQKITETSACNFLNNKFSGKFNYNVNNVNIEGEFDKNGFFNGTWVISWKTYEGVPFKEIRNYKNGYCYKSVYRNLSDGQIINKSNTSEISESIALENIINDTIVSVNANKYKIEIVEKSDVDNTIFEDVYNDSYKGLDKIYNALGFWICSSSMRCHFFMSSSKVDFMDGNFLYEIDYGNNNIEFAFEKKITLIE